MFKKEESVEITSSLKEEGWEITVKPNDDLREKAHYISHVEISGRNFSQGEKIMGKGPLGEYCMKEHPFTTVLKKSTSTEISMKIHFVNRCTLSCSDDLKITLDQEKPTKQIFSFQTVFLDFNQRKKREFKEEEKEEKISKKKKKQ